MHRWVKGRAELLPEEQPECRRRREQHGLHSAEAIDRPGGLHSADHLKPANPGVRDEGPQGAAAVTVRVPLPGHIRGGLQAAAVLQLLSRGLLRVLLIEGKGGMERGMPVFEIPSGGLLFLG